MRDDPLGLGRMPSDASLTPPPFGAWCRACRGTRWEGEAASVPIPRAHPLFRQAGIDLDEG
jgi:hypothetical protein